MEKVKAHKSTIASLDANIVACIPYLGVVLGFMGVGRWFCFIIPLVVFLIEKKSIFVKKNTFLAFSLNIIQIILYIIVYLIFSSNKLCVFGYCETIERYLTSTGVTMLNIVSFLALIVAGIGIIKAFKYEEIDIPYLNEIRDKIMDFSNKLKNKNQVKKEDKE